MKQILNLALLAFLAIVPKEFLRAESAATNSVVVTADYLGQLAEEMRTNNPALRSAAAMANAAAAAVASVRTWKDPMLVAGGLSAREPMRADEGDIIYGVEQELPLFGKPGLERNVARAELATETANSDYQFQKLRVELAKSAFRAALASRIVAVGEKDLAWLGSIEQSIEGNAHTGKSSLAEILQIQSEQARLVTQLQTERGELANGKVTMNRLLNRADQSPWPEFELPPVAGAVNYNQRLLDFALSYEPKTLVQQKQVKRAEAMVDVARRQRYPDVAAGVEARSYSGDGSFRQAMITLRMSLPWLNNGKINADIRREQSRLSAAQFDLADERLAVREEVHRLVVKIDAARREALLYRDQIIPRAETTLESVRSGWQVGQNTFREMLDTHRLLLDARLNYSRAISEQYQMLSELVLCCGLGDLGALQMIGAEPDKAAPPATSPANNPPTQK